ncbi:hypothetical protein GWI33_013939 [Rhynchophorus ferrugineus]|uniref:Uncharacterized protein n=1 Tax=Rhynchophorus ferrugineus TaxID=354439 RepID=A0A834I634_RHYFE|nr:hypothetical protein GWI33_013939 [Rhynchophorus ferrugineus]
MSRGLSNQPQGQTDQGVNLFEDISEVWRDPPEEVVSSSQPSIIKRETVSNALTNIFCNEMQTTEMTNLGHILMGRTEDRDDKVEDSDLTRLSFADQKLDQMPRLICDEFGTRVKTLDISNNSFRNIDFLERFKELTSLILDKNPISSHDANIPWLPHLELLYLNFCRISDLYWVESLRYNCPNLKYLSLMGNPVAHSPATGGCIYEYLRYRLYVISVLPKLVHLDDKQITDDERKESRKMYPRPVLQNMVKSTRRQLPRYFRNWTNRMGNLFSGASSNRNTTRRPTSLASDHSHGGQNNVVI